MNILIKLMSIVSLVIAPTIAKLHNTDGVKLDKKVPVEVVVKKAEKVNAVTVAIK